MDVIKAVGIVLWSAVGAVTVSGATLYFIAPKKDADIAQTSLREDAPPPNSKSNLPEPKVSTQRSSSVQTPAAEKPNIVAPAQTKPIETKQPNDDDATKTEGLAIAGIGDKAAPPKGPPLYKTNSTQLWPCDQMWGPKFIEVFHRQSAAISALYGSNPPKLELCLTGSSSITLLDKTYEFPVVRFYFSKNEMEICASGGACPKQRLITIKNIRDQPQNKVFHHYVFDVGGPPALHYCFSVLGQRIDCP